MMREEGERRGGPRGETDESERTLVIRLALGWKQPTQYSTSANSGKGIGKGNFLIGKSSSWLPGNGKLNQEAPNHSTKSLDQITRHHSTKMMGRNTVFGTHGDH